MPKGKKGTKGKKAEIETLAHQEQREVHPPAPAAAGPAMVNSSQMDPHDSLSLIVKAINHANPAPPVKFFATPSSALASEGTISLSVEERLLHVDFIFKVESVGNFLSCLNQESSHLLPETNRGRPTNAALAASALQHALDTAVHDFSIIPPGRILHLILTPVTTGDDLQDLVSYKEKGNKYIIKRIVSQYAFLPQFPCLISHILFTFFFCTRQHSGVEIGVR